MNIQANIASRVRPGFPSGLEPSQSSGVLEAADLPTLAKRRGVLSQSKTVPRVSPLLLQWFTWYSRRYLRQHFHSLRISRSGLPPVAADLPLVVYANHASWWDALVFLVTKNEFFPDRTAFAPMDAAMLERYQFFRKLGFFGVDQKTRRGAAQFLRIAEVVLQSPQTLLAITPQSRFVDVRERPLRFAPGLGHLAARIQQAAFVPFAVEYVFWEERLPEILIRFGEPLEIRSRPRTHSDADNWTARFEQELAKAQEDLAVEAKRRNPADFQILLSGGAGQGGVYDWWRFWKAGIRGETFRKEHGNK
jgi:1-acyl-sn-glycerol-3-phosphate acyltransferase